MGAGWFIASGMRHQTRQVGRHARKGDDAALLLLIGGIAALTLPGAIVGGLLAHLAGAGTESMALGVCVLVGAVMGAILSLFLVRRVVRWATSE